MSRSESPVEVKKGAEEKGKSVVGRLQDWGSSAIPPSLLATLVIALHSRPRQPLPLLLFTPPLFLSTYLSLAGFPTAAGGISAAWSGLYSLLALRRRQGLGAKMSVRGAVRGVAVGVGIVNCVAGGLVYARGDFGRDEEERRRANRWG
ncbi:hypothetical protein ACRE_006190 [Hapsidospora chrysogenum ATCC 11550]|uniref:Uncharacterized protein n=1 Tax=Hapsidospora chrysogenum (strain ATCC 11550 / CBS 779.69 / DSM 880 / IAM 14645 / JCM 23072 / IMI 49137) TaxID=857340 RepID=A0A086TGQ0_HAPC1|nr:hypothetical protein ACRE_006190 [Hapsidospora chrysogenum ATCC 11550]